MLTNVWWKVSSEDEFTAIEQRLHILGYEWQYSRTSVGNMRIALIYGGMALNDKGEIVFQLPNTRTSYREINPRQVFGVDISDNVDKIVRNNFDKIVKDVLSGKDVFVYLDGRKCKVYLSHFFGFMVNDIVGPVGKLTPELCKDMDMSTTEVNGKIYLTAELYDAITKADIYPVS